MATSRNKLLFRRFLDKIEERDQASLPLAMEMVFAQFLREKRLSENETDFDQENGGATYDEHKIVLLFTDGITDGIWPTEIIQNYQKEHPNEPVRIRTQINF